jgi:hypothetical protein
MNKKSITEKIKANIPLTPLISKIQIQTNG